LIFGQQHATTGPWFHSLYGQAHTISIEDFPHTRALAGDPDCYLEYLRTSWAYYGRENTPASRRRQLERLMATPAGPIKVVTRPDGKKLVVDGNHRAARAHADGDDPVLIEIPDGRWLTKVTTNRGERYGSKPGKPYQSVFHDGREWVVGRRRDTLIRHETIGETGVLDLGCNIGASTLLAAGHGVDASPKLITTAWRLAAFFASPATFQVGDLTTDVFDHETMFCFAVVAHLTDLTALRATLAQADTVYFEENAGRRQLPKVADLFTEITELPAERPLYRCR
jgi:hypothetical protein